MILCLLLSAKVIYHLVSLKNMNSTAADLQVQPAYFPPCFLNWLPVRLQPIDDVSAGGRSRGGPSGNLSAFDRITSASKVSA